MDIKNCNELIASAESEIIDDSKSTGLMLGSIPVKDQTSLLGMAQSTSKELMKIIEKQSLYTVIGGNKFIRLEGWTTLGALLGISPREVSCEKNSDGDWVAVVELININTGSVIGRASGFLGSKEGEKQRNGWCKREEYAKRSMAITRATSKAFRLSFSFIAVLAGYQPTPAEEMPEKVVEVEVIKEIEIPIVIDKSQIRAGFGYASKDGKDGLTKYFKELSSFEKKAFTGDEWKEMTETFLGAEE